MIIAEIIPHKQFKIRLISLTQRQIIPIIIIVESIANEHIETLIPNNLFNKKDKTSTPPVDPFPRKVRDIPKPTQIPPHIPQNNKYPISEDISIFCPIPPITSANSTKTSTRVKRVRNAGNTSVATKVIKGKLSKQAEEYIKVLYQNVNDYLFSGENFSKLDVKAYGQLKDELFIDAGFYKNIKGTKSRNLVSVYNKYKQMADADLAANILVKNRLSPMFLGKFYDYTSSYSKEGKRIIMQIKGGQLSRPVDDIDDLKLVESTDAYLIYTNDDEWRKTLNQHTIKDILKLKIDKTLIDVLISIRKNKCSIGIDYIDEFMNIPVEHEFDFNNVKRTELDLNKVLTIFDDLNN